jgi:hypothetical protein
MYPTSGDRLAIWAPCKKSHLWHSQTGGKKHRMVISSRLLIVSPRNRTQRQLCFAKHNIGSWNTFQFPPVTVNTVAHATEFFFEVIVYLDGIRANPFR